MKSTRHAQKRCSQRGFTADLIQLIQDFGYVDGDRHIMDGRNGRTVVACINRMIEVLLKKRTQFLKVCDKGGGVAVVGDNGKLITVFSPRTYTRRAARRSRRSSNLGWA
jgi:hypothetical protein